VTAIIRTEKLTKSYGSHGGIIDVDMTVEQGKVFGFLGPHEAGKTTTIRTLLDLIRASSGKAFGFGIGASAPPALQAGHGPPISPLTIRRCPETKVTRASTTVVTRWRGHSGCRRRRDDQARELTKRSSKSLDQGVELHPD
jgi:ABC-type multidrug transport system ATPase subunit